MSKSKYVLIVTVLLFAMAAGWIFWRSNLYSGNEFLIGDSISVIDQFQDEFISSSRFTKPLNAIKGEELVNGWQKLADFQTVSVWRSFAKNPIIGAQAPRLYTRRLELQWQGHLFAEDTRPNSWNFSNNQVFITVGAGANPKDSNYFLDYQTSTEPHTMQISGEELSPLSASSINASKRDGWTHYYPLQHSLMIRSANPSGSEIILRRDGKILTEGDWKPLPEFKMQIFRSSIFGVFEMFRRTDVFRQNLYLPSGLVDFKITAKGHFAGEEFPRLAIYLDEIKVGQIQINRTERDVYSAVSPVQEGNNRFKLIFENDFYDPKTKAYRKVDLEEVSLDYKPAVLIKEKTGAKAERHRIDYLASDSVSSTFYWDFVRERKLNNEWSHSVITAVPLQDELRSSLVLTPGDSINVPVQLANDSRLQFGYGWKSPGRENIGRFVIKIHRPFHLTETIFSEDLNRNDVWKEKSVDLSRYSGEKVRLSFEALDPKQNVDSFLLFVSNPELLSDAQPVKLVFLLSFDALRADHLGIYGYQRPTSPSIDAFARDSVLFENASTPATWTLPSFGSVFTSLYPSFHDARDYSKPLGRSLHTLPELINRKGYSTAAFVHNPLLHPLYGFAKGFDSYNYHISKNARERVTDSLAWLQFSKASKKFLFVHLINPHSPWMAPQQYLRRVSGDQMDSARIDPSAYSRFLHRKACEKLDNKDLEDLKWMYDAEILQADDLFQIYIRRLKESGLYDDSMIILMSDHGEEFLDHGTTFHGENVFPATGHVPLIIKFPAQDRLRGLRVRERVSLIDIMPTILDVLGIQKPADTQGESLLSKVRVRAENQNTNRILFTENRNGILGITRGNYQYIYTEASARNWTCPPRKLEELYDLELDPGVQRDMFPGPMDLLTLFRREREQYISRAQAFRKAKLGSDSARKVEPEPELQEQIRALGYLQ